MIAGEITWESFGVKVQVVQGASLGPQCVQDPWRKHAVKVGTGQGGRKGAVDGVGSATGQQGLPASFVTALGVVSV